MGELESKITDILNSPEDMQKILNIARSFTGGDISIPEPEQKEERPVPKPVPEPIPAPSPEVTPETKENPSGFSLDDLEINPEMLKTLGSVMGELTSSPGGGNKSSMLDTITPFLKTERQTQLKRAFSLAKMAKVALGIFTDSGKGSG